MVIDVGVQIVLMELINHRCQVLSDMAIAKVLFDDRTIFGSNQSVIVGVSSPGFGQFDQEFLEELDPMLIDVLGAVIGVKAKNNKRELIQ